MQIDDAEYRKRIEQLANRYNIDAGTVDAMAKKEFAKRIDKKIAEMLFGADMEAKKDERP